MTIKYTLSINALDVKYIKSFFLHFVFDFERYLTGIPHYVIS